jgi:hypothetical protein
LTINGFKWEKLTLLTNISWYRQVGWLNLWRGWLDLLINWERGVVVLKEIRKNIWEKSSCYVLFHLKSPMKFSLAILLSFVCIHDMLNCQQIFYWFFFLFCHLFVASFFNFLVMYDDFDWFKDFFSSKKRGKIVKILVSSLMPLF